MNLGRKTSVRNSLSRVARQNPLSKCELTTVRLQTNKCAASFESSSYTNLFL